MQGSPRRKIAQKLSDCLTPEGYESNDTKAGILGKYLYVLTAKDSWVVVDCQVVVAVNKMDTY